VQKRIERHGLIRAFSRWVAGLADLNPVKLLWDSIASAGIVIVIMLFHP